MNLICVGYNLDEKILCNIREIGFSSDSDEPTKLEEVQMFTSKIQKFIKIERYRSIPESITFHIQLKSTHSNFNYLFVDSTWKDQLWSATSAKNSTDVEFIIGEESVGAHRFILSARSPIFEVMFESELNNESPTRIIHMEDVDPATFRFFLQFIYTGIIDPSADKEELYALADKYFVNTLEDFCKPVV